MINYKHLRYFWMVAREGSIVNASKLLFLTPQTISGQLTQLEEQLGVKLFEKDGRNLKLTEAGKVVQNYANDIFSLGNELQEVLHNAPSQRLLRLNVGVANSIPKSVAYHLLEPALHKEEAIRLVCREDNLNALLRELAEHKIDLVISDRPMSHHSNIKGFNHHLGVCGISFFCTPELKKSMKAGLPDCLDNMPFLLPGDASSMHIKLKEWFKTKGVFPAIVAEFDDGALMKAFGQKGAGIFVAPSITAKEVKESYHVEIIGETQDIKEDFYAISIQRKVSHPVIAKILSAAREQFFLVDT